MTCGFARKRTRVQLPKKSFPVFAEFFTSSVNGEYYQTSNVYMRAGDQGLSMVAPRKFPLVDGHIFGFDVPRPVMSLISATCISYGNFCAVIKKVALTCGFDKSAFQHHCLPAVLLAIYGNFCAVIKNSRKEISVNNSAPVSAIEGAF